MASKSSGYRTSYVTGHGAKQPLSKVAEVSGSTIDISKSRGVTPLLVVENTVVKETAVDNVMPQDSGFRVRNEIVEAVHKADKGSSAENAVKESGSSSNAAPLKPFRVSDPVYNIQSENRYGAEFPIADNGIKIVIERREAYAGLDVYERAKSGKGPADGMSVKLRIPL